MVVTGEPVIERKDGTVAATEVTVPPPDAGVAQAGAPNIVVKT